MSATAERTIRIGELAQLTGTTPRTIRYYEEIGLLDPRGAREVGKHRSYSAADAERLKEIVRLRNLLGLSLEQLTQLLEAETARAEIGREYRATPSEDAERQRYLLTQAGGHIETQLGLVRGRLGELQMLERELTDKQALVAEKIAALSA